MNAVVDLKNISKRFGSVEVLSNVSMELRAGRVHALAGANGAGKSTLVKIFAGVHQPDAGTIRVDGVEVTIAGTADARRQGISVIHQHPALFPDLTVAENIFVGRQPTRLGRIDWPEMRRNAGALIDRIGMKVDVDARVKDLGVAERQAVAIAAALSSEVRVLIMDEPTSAISAHELEQFFAVVERLKKEGVAILFITHFLDEIFAISDDITVLRSGKHIVTAVAADLTPASVITHMIGTATDDLFPTWPANIGKTVLSVDGLCGADGFDDISFDVRAGEIIGFFGLVGAGRSEVAEAIFGLRKTLSGSIAIDGRKQSIRSPREAIEQGISLVPEDRHEQGLVLQFPNRANTSLALLRRISDIFGRIRGEREETLAETYSRRLGVVATGIEQLTGTLSGGNQQKVLLAKWLALEPRVLILDQPTRGVDVGAKADIYRIISELASAGLAIILIGDDPDEVMAMSNRVLVFRNGRIAARFERGAFDREGMLTAAAHSPVHSLNGEAA
ncbi:MAG: sugar ABC transporter ATP-binding protein [Rhizobiaceae bacterium]|nr:sugar ABC transporter ATP-binding protein [Rhizobiaceae bacterium]